MTAKILVINPNSTVAVTAGIDLACEPLRLADGPAIECITLAEGPPGIESQQHVDGVVAPLLSVLKSRSADCSAFVIACYSDPGLHSCREAMTQPVLGISECGLLTAMTLGHRIGVIAILSKSIPRHLRYVGAMGIGDRLAAERPLGLGVTELSDESRTLDRMITTGLQLKEQDGADVLVMGCAGMARYRDRLQHETGLPVVEPTQAAVTMALGRVRLGW